MAKTKSYRCLLNSEKVKKEVFAPTAVRQRKEQRDNMTHMTHNHAYFPKGQK